MFYACYALTCVSNDLNFTAIVQTQRKFPARPPPFCTRRERCKIPTRKFVVLLCTCSFKRDSKVGNFDIEKFIADIELDDSEKKQYCLPNTTKVQAFLDYRTQYYKKPIDQELRQLDDALEQVGIYDDKEALAGSDNEVTCTYTVDPTHNWKTYRRQPRSNHRLRQQYSGLCRYKYNCGFGTRCQSKHTDEEKIYFKGRIEGRGNPRRKVHSCKFFDQIPPCCTKMKLDCEYAHGEDDAWCLNCISSGHYTDNCPEKSIASAV